MECNSTDLFEVLTIILQYETGAFCYSSKGILYIDGLKASRSMTQYEKMVLKRLGFETGEKFGIRQITKTK